MTTPYPLITHMHYPMIHVPGTCIYPVFAYNNFNKIIYSKTVVQSSACRGGKDTLGPGISVPFC